MYSVPAGPGMSHDPLEDARDRRGGSPGSWLAESLRGTGAPLITLRVPPGGTGEVLAVSGTPALPGSLVLPEALAQPESLALPESLAPPEALAQLSGSLAHHGRLPLRSRSVSAIVLEMCLPAVPGLDDLFAELRRVLRPAGTIAALVPSRPGHLALMWRTLHRSMGGRPRFRNESARDNPHWLFVAADFAVLADQRRTFHLPVPDGVAAAQAVDTLVLGGVWPADLTPVQLDLARRALTRYAAPGRSLPIPLRLLVARR